MEYKLIYPDYNINNLIINYLDLGNLLKMTTINKFYYNLINNFEFINEFKKIIKINKIDLEDKNDLFSKSCTNGFINLSKFLYKNYVINVHYNERNDILKIICVNGHFEMVKWLMKITNNCKKESVPFNYTYIYISYKCFLKAFIACCKTGNLEIMKCIIPNINKDYLDLIYHYQHDKPFHIACVHGHLELARLLVSIGKELKSPVDMWAFRPAYIVCYNNGHTKLNWEEWVEYLNMNN